MEGRYCCARQGWAATSTAGFQNRTDTFSSCLSAAAAVCVVAAVAGRQTYVFNASGKCVLSFNDQLNAEKHVEEALSALKSA
jgi:peroxiredoxin